MPIQNNIPTAPNQTRITNLTSVAQAISTGPATLYGFNIINPTAAVAYVKFYDVSGSVTVGTSPVTKTIEIKANDSVFIPVHNPILYFSNKIDVAVTTGLADSDTTAPASDLTIEVNYK